MSSICIIPARGGSKRIPRKNIKLFYEKPIIAYSIEAALESELFDEVMVSTDDDEIAEVAIKYGAKVPFKRSKENSDDLATTIQVLHEVVSEYSKQEMFFEYVCCLYPCAPLVSSKNLKHAHELLIQNNAKSVFPIVEYSHPIQRAIKLESGKLSNVYPNYNNTRTQDLEKTYHDSGQFYFMKSVVIERNEEVVGNSCYPIVISSLECQDIDNEQDWKLAELKYTLMNNAK